MKKDHRFHLYCGYASLALSTAAILPFLVLVLAGLLAGCSPSKPKAANAEKAAIARIANESEGRIKVISFQLVGSEPTPVADGYFWNYKAVLEFTENCRWKLDRATETVNVDFKTMPSQVQPGEETNGRPMKQGERRRLTGTVDLKKSKQGWQAVLVMISTNHKDE